MRSLVLAYLTCILNLYKLSLASAQDDSSIFANLFVPLSDGESDGSEPQVEGLIDYEDGDEDDDDDDDNDGPEMPNGVALCGLPIRRDVVVVGAGLAGMFASATLQKKGTTYILVEADEIPGGRLRSFETPFVKEVNSANGEETFYNLEEGANFMYGKGDNFGINPIYGLFEKYGTENEVIDTLDWETYKPNGKNKYTDKTVRKVRNKYARKQRNCLDETGEEWFEEFVETPDEISDDKSTEDILAECGKDGWFPDTPLKQAIQRVYHNQEHALTASDTGKASYPEDSFIDFDGRVFFQKDAIGSTFATSEFVRENLMETCGPAQKDTGGCVHFNSKVTRIRFRRKPKNSHRLSRVVALRTNEDGSVCKQVYRGSYVINTMPQNVNIEEQKRVFKPNLNIDKHPIQQNFVEKVFLQFETAWWEESMDPVKQWLVITKVIPEEEEEEGDEEKSTLFFNYNHPDILPGSNILLAFIDKYQLAAMGGSIDVAKVAASLDHLPGWEAPTKSHVTDFNGNRFFRGSWEIWPLGAGNYKDFDDAIQPQGTLHLAGAAHCSRYWGFTWGAIFSGIWNADVINERMDGVSLDDAIEAAYTPCQDTGNISRKDWRKVYKCTGKKGPCDFFFPVPQNTYPEDDADDDEDTAL